MHIIFGINAVAEALKAHGRAFEWVGVAKERNVTMSRALVTLAERGVQAEAEARAKLTGAYDKFMAQGDPVRKSEAGADLIRAIFGRDAIAEDPLR